MISVRRLGPVAVGVVAFRDPAPHIAVVAKLTVTLPEPGTAADAALCPDPIPLLDAEEGPFGRAARPAAGDELATGSDFAPRKASLDVTMSGFARADVAAMQLPVTLHVGDRLARDLVAVAAAPTRRLPLVAAHLRDARTGAVASLAPRRSRGAVAHPPRPADATERSWSPVWIDLAPTETGSSFRAASSDLQMPLDAAPGAALVASGVADGALVLRTRLPTFRPYVLAMSAHGDAVRVELRCDTLHVDVDGRRATLVFRGALSVHLSAAPPTLVVGVEPHERRTELRDVAAWLGQAATATAQLSRAAIDVGAGSWNETRTSQVAAPAPTPDDAPTHDASGAPPPAFLAPRPDLGQLGSGTATLEITAELREALGPDPASRTEDPLARFKAATKDSSQAAAGPPRPPPQPVDPRETRVGSGTVDIATVVRRLREKGELPFDAGGAPTPVAPSTTPEVAPPAAPAPPSTGTMDLASVVKDLASKGALPFGGETPGPAAPRDVPAAPPAVAPKPLFALGQRPEVADPPHVPPSPPAGPAPAPSAEDAETTLDRGPLSLEEYADVRVALADAVDRPVAAVLRAFGLDVVSWSLEAARWARRLDAEAERGEVRTMQELVRLIRERQGR